MAAGLTGYKDSGRTQVLDNGTVWTTYEDFGTVDITSNNSSADIPIYWKDTGTTPLSNIYTQAAPASLTTLNGSVTASTTVTVFSTTNLAVGMAIDIATPIADPGVSSDYSYPLSPTYKAQNVVITAIASLVLTLSSAVTAANGDAIFTAGTLSLLGQIATAPDNSGSAGVYGAGGATTLSVVGPLTAISGTGVSWTKAQWLSSDIEGTHKFAIRARFTSG